MLFAVAVSQIVGLVLTGIGSGLSLGRAAAAHTMHRDPANRTGRPAALHRTGPPRGLGPRARAMKATRTPPAEREGFRPGPELKIAFVITLAAAVGVGLFEVLAAAGTDPNRPALADFNFFHIVGHLVTSGHFADAYRMDLLLQLENKGADPSHQVFMPWPYPPAFGFIVALLAYLPLGGAYLAFVLPTLALYVWALRRLAKAQAWPVILAVAPCLIINIRTGQNGLMIGGFYALAALLALRRRPRAAGIVMGALAMKPHLALTLPVLLALQRQWLTLAVAAAASLALTGLSFLVFGPGVFAGFAGGFGKILDALADGDYPLHRMSSLYAGLRAAGVPSSPAFALHGLLAAALLAATVRAIVRTQGPEAAIGARGDERGPSSAPMSTTMT